MGALESMSIYPKAPPLPASEVLARARETVSRANSAAWVAAVQAFSVSRQIRRVIDETLVEDGARQIKQLWRLRSAHAVVVSGYRRI